MRGHGGEHQQTGAGEPLGVVGAAGAGGQHEARARPATALTSSGQVPGPGADGAAHAQAQRSDEGRATEDRRPLRR